MGWNTLYSPLIARKCKSVFNVSYSITNNTDYRKYPGERKGDNYTLSSKDKEMKEVLQEYIWDNQ